jgi:integrase
LRRYRLVQIERCAEHEVTWSESGWMFSIDGGTTPLRPQNVSTYVSALAKKAGCAPGVVLHSLRHWAGTTLNAAGHDPRTIADLLGHSRTSTTMDTYVRALPEKGREAAEYLGSLLDLPGVSLSTPIGLAAPPS